ncbi:SCO4225 family membrane protein [Streptomyces virginiae]|uniref:SCO4225 family membrane protein n=1 Tax=Streptomyces virginiae TaxID=1961 RepID=UPI0036685303
MNRRPATGGSGPTPGPDPAPPDHGGSPHARGSLGLVGAAVAFATAVTLFAPDPGLVWVLPALCAFPLFLFATLIRGAALGDGQPATWLFLTELVLCGVLCVLTESLALGTIVEASRGSLRGRPRAS